LNLFPIDLEYRSGCRDLLLWGRSIFKPVDRMIGRTPMRRGVLAGVLALLLAASADAAPRQRRAAESPAGRSSDPSSLDGRVAGQPRTCGFDTFIYSPSGGTVGPYCH
jgi:hypothetical protein